MKGGWFSFQTLAFSGCQPDCLLGFRVQGLGFGLGQILRTPTQLHLVSLSDKNSHESVPK